MQQSEILIRNTVISYGRLAVVTLAVLVAHRLLLERLGVETYGVLAALNALAMLGTLFSTALSTGVQRHLAYEYGREDDEEVRRVFAAAQMVFLLIAAAFVVAAIALRPVVFPAIGLPSDAVRPYYLVCATTALLLLAGANTCLFVARQRFALASVVQVSSALAALAGALLIGRVPGDALAVYTGVLCLVQLGTTAWVLGYGTIRFPEARLRAGLPGRGHFHAILRFFGWSAFGHATSYAANHGLVLLAYAVFGPATAAAFELAAKLAALARHVGHALSQIVQPAMAAASGRGDLAAMRHLGLQASRYAALATLLLTVPMLVSPDALFGLWLGDYPAEAPAFARLFALGVTAAYLGEGHGMASVARGGIALPTTLFAGVQLPVVLVTIGVVTAPGPQAPSWMLPLANLLGAVGAATLYALVLGRVHAMAPETWLRAVVAPVTIVGLGAFLCGQLARSAVGTGARDFGALALEVGLLLLATSAAAAVLGWLVGITRAERGRLTAVLRPR